MTPSEVEPGLAASDRALALAASLGDRDAFGAIAVRHREAVRRTVAHRVFDRDDVEDIVQLTFLHALAGIAGFDLERPLRPWLLAIARNSASDFGRRAGRSSASDALDETASDAPGPEQCVVRAETAARVRVALESLPERQRLVIRLLFEERLRYREIAERLALPLGTVKTHVFRSKAALAPILADAAAAC